MIALILLLAVGLGIAYFATHNTGMISISLANYIFYGIPVYVIVIASLLLGIVVSWLVSIPDYLSSIFTLRGKDAILNQAKKTIEQLEETVRRLEVENARLKGEIHKPVLSEESKEKKGYPLINRLKDRVGITY